jgi:hypothetical protein
MVSVFPPYVKVKVVVPAMAVTMPLGRNCKVVSAPSTTGIPEPESGIGHEGAAGKHRFVYVPILLGSLCIWMVEAALSNTT